MSSTCCYSCPILIKLQFSRQLFEKYPNIKFHEHPFSVSRVFPCEQTQTDRQTDTTKLIVPFPSFHNAPKSSVLYLTVCLRFHVIFTKTYIIYELIYQLDAIFIV